MKKIVPFFILFISLPAFACIVEPTEVDLDKIKVSATVKTSRVILIKSKREIAWKENEALKLDRVANKTYEYFIDNQVKDIKTDLVINDGEDKKIIHFDIKASAHPRGANSNEALLGIPKGIPQGDDLSSGCGGPQSVTYE